MATTGTGAQSEKPKPKPKQISFHAKACDTCGTSPAALADFHSMLAERSKTGEGDLNVSIKLHPTSKKRTLVVTLLD